MPGEGKSTVALNLALTAAASGSRTILVEADLRRPSLTTSLSLASRAGLAGILLNDLALDEAIQEYTVGGESEERSLDVIAAGGSPPNPLDVLGSSRMSELSRRAWEALRARSDRQPSAPSRHGRRSPHPAIQRCPHRRPDRGDHASCPPRASPPTRHPGHHAAGDRPQFHRHRCWLLRWLPRARPRVDEREREGSCRRSYSSVTPGRPRSGVDDPAARRATSNGPKMNNPRPRVRLTPPR